MSVWFFFLYTFVKNWVAIAVLVYFWVLNNVPFVYMSIFAPMSPYLCPHGSVAQFEVNIGIPLAVSFCLELLWLSVIFHINLRIFFLFCKEGHWMLALEVGARVSSMWPLGVTYYMQVTCSSFRSSFQKLSS